MSHLLLTTPLLLSVAEFVQNTDILLSVAACASLAEVGRACSLPLPDHSETDSDVTKKSIVDALLKKVQTDNVHSKVRHSYHTRLSELPPLENAPNHFMTLKIT